MKLPKILSSYSNFIAKASLFFKKVPGRELYINNKSIKVIQDGVSYIFYWNDTYKQHVGRGPNDSDYASNWGVSNSLEFDEVMEFLIRSFYKKCLTAECKFGIEIEYCLKNPDLDPDFHSRLFFTNIGYDGSVKNGREVRFKPLELKEYLNPDIEKDFKRVFKYLNAYGIYRGVDSISAGMHVHYSCLNPSLAADNMSDFVSKHGWILELISGRYSYNGYGLRIGSFRDQSLETYKTFELRIWSSTDDYDVIVARVIFTKYFVDFLHKYNEDFWNKMHTKGLKAYKYLLFHKDNPLILGKNYLDAIMELQKRKI